jgi:hypothetical protein
MVTSLSLLLLQRCQHGLQLPLQSLHPPLQLRSLRPGSCLHLLLLPLQSLDLPTQLCSLCSGRRQLLLPVLLKAGELSQVCRLLEACSRCCCSSQTRLSMTAGCEAGSSAHTDSSCTHTSGRKLPS